MKAKPDEAKGFSLETTFNDDLVSLEQALPILLEQCDILAARMRRKKKKCTCISVTFRTLDFRNKSHQTKLPNATDITEEIYRNAQNLFQESWMRQPLRLLGVSLTGLTMIPLNSCPFLRILTRRNASRNWMQHWIPSV